jgi:protein phosphatase
LPLIKRDVLFGSRPMKISHSARTDVGQSRDHNEDSYGVGDGEPVERFGDLIVVCDGMGGHAAGEVASRVAVDAILSVYYTDTSDERPLALEHAFDTANEQIYETGHGSMGTTGVAALLHHDALHVANVGDSRAYIIRDGQIRQITRDHSFVSDQVAAGLITPEQARSSPHRNVITRALGYQSEVSVDLFRLPLQIGDTVVLCSDGLHGLVADEEIAELVETHGPEAAVDQLIDLANQRGGPDNITVVIARVDALDWDSQPVSPADLDAQRERVTVELPLEDDDDQPAPAPSALPPDVPVLAPAPPRRGERRLTLLGGLLAVVLLVVLLAGSLFALRPELVTPQPATIAPAPGASPAPTSVPASATSVPATSTVPAPTAPLFVPPTTLPTSSPVASTATTQP